MKLTMKLPTTIFILLLCCNAYGQRWHFERIDSTSKFKYEYWFQFDNIEDTTTFRFEKKIGQIKSTIKLANNFGDTVIFASIRIKGLDNDTLININSDINGLVEIKLGSGKYCIEISATNFDNFLFDFNISKEEYFDLNIKLGLAPELTVYQINSRTELKEKEIHTIMNCVKKNRHDYYKKCINKDRYQIIFSTSPESAFSLATASKMVFSARKPVSTPCSYLPTAVTGMPSR